MATYTELFNLRVNSDLINKITVAISVKAQIILDLASPTVKQVTWATAAIADAQGKAGVILNYLLAKNAALSVEQILTASDATLQTQVNAVVDKIIDGGTV